MEVNFFSSFSPDYVSWDLHLSVILHHPNPSSEIDRYLESCENPADGQRNLLEQLAESNYEKRGVILDLLSERDGFFEAAGSFLWNRPKRALIFFSLHDAAMIGRGITELHERDTFCYFRTALGKVLDEPDASDWLDRLLLLLPLHMHPHFFFDCGLRFKQCVIETLLQKRSSCEERISVLKGMLRKKEGTQVIPEFLARYPSGLKDLLLCLQQNPSGISELLNLRSVLPEKILYCLPLHLSSFDRRQFFSFYTDDLPTLTALLGSAEQESTSFVESLKIVKDCLSILTLSCQVAFVNHSISVNACFLPYLSLLVSSSEFSESQLQCLLQKAFMPNRHYRKILQRFLQEEFKDRREQFLHDIMFRYERSSSTFFGAIEVCLQALQQDNLQAWEACFEDLRAFPPYCFSLAVLDSSLRCQIAPLLRFLDDEQIRAVGAALPVSAVGSELSELCKPLMNHQMHLFIHAFDAHQKKIASQEIAKYAKERLETFGLQYDAFIKSISNNERSVSLIDFFHKLKRRSMEFEHPYYLTLAKELPSECLVQARSDLTRYAAVLSPASELGQKMRCVEEQIEDDELTFPEWAERKLTSGVMPFLGISSFDDLNGVGIFGESDLTLLRITEMQQAEIARVQIALFARTDASRLVDQLWERVLHPRYRLEDEEYASLVLELAAKTTIDTQEECYALLKAVKDAGLIFDRVEFDQLERQNTVFSQAFRTRVIFFAINFVKQHCFYGLLSRYLFQSDQLQRIWQDFREHNLANIEMLDDCEQIPDVSDYYHLDLIHSLFMENLKDASTQSETDTPVADSPK